MKLNRLIGIISILLQKDKTTISELAEKFGKRFFATPKKMGAETAEANVNAGLAAARQIVAFFKEGVTRFQVNR